jgi:hypothetical protein
MVGAGSVCVVQFNPVAVSTPTRLRVNTAHTATAPRRCPTAAILPRGRAKNYGLAIPQENAADPPEPVPLNFAASEVEVLPLPTDAPSGQALVTSPSQGKSFAGLTRNRRASRR